MLGGREVEKEGKDGEQPFFSDFNAELDTRARDYVLRRVNKNRGFRRYDSKVPKTVVMRL